MKKFKISIEQANERLDKFLAAELGDFSRSHIQKLINEGEVLLNGKIPTAHYKLKENDILAVKNTEIKVKKEKQTAVKNLPELEIVSDTDEYLVLNKPAGLIVHGAGHIKEATLVDALVKKYPKIKKVGDDPLRPGIVHRLDKDVSGLMVVAKTQKAFESLKKQFQDRTIDKEYAGLVYGQINKDHDVINFPIERSSSGFKMAAKPKTHKGELNPEGKEAITEFFVEKKFINYTFLRIKILTGRTHQIRAHMAAYGHTLVGDPLYGTPRNRAANKKLGSKRVFLMANRLVFMDLEGERQEFKLSLPAEFTKILASIK